MMFEACARRGYITNINRISNNSISFTYSLFPASNPGHHSESLTNDATLTKHDFKLLHQGYQLYRGNQGSNKLFSEWVSDQHLGVHWKMNNVRVYQQIFGTFQSKDPHLKDNINYLYSCSSNQEEFSTRLMSQFPQSGTQPLKREANERQELFQIPPKRVDKNTMIASLEQYQQRMDNLLVNKSKDNLLVNKSKKMNCKKFKIRENTKWRWFKKDGLSVDLYKADNGKEIFLGSLKLKNINGNPLLSYKGKITDKVLHDAAIIYVEALARGNAENITSINIASDLTHDQATKFQQELMSQGVAINKITLPIQNMIDNENSSSIRHNRPDRIKNSIRTMGGGPNNKPHGNRVRRNIDTMSNDNTSSHNNDTQKPIHSTNSSSTIFNNHNDFLLPNKGNDRLPALSSVKGIV